MEKEIKQYVQAGKKNLTLLYILNLCGIFLPLLPLIVVVSAFFNKDGEDRYLETHYIFLLRTFFIGLIAAVIAFIMIMTLVFINPMLVLITPVIYIALIIWFLLRVVFGFKYLLNDTTHPNYKTFWVK